LKPELRQAMRAKRRALSAAEQALAAQRLAARVTATRWFRVSRRIACYMPTDGEIDPGDVLEAIWSMRKQAFLPVLSRLTRDRLWFGAMRPGTALEPNRYRIPEPQVPARQLVRAQALDLILLPLVAFDTEGNRLGMGGGFYDNSLAFLRHRRHLRKPYLLGLAHDFQRVSGLPADAWDIPLDGIATDDALYRVGTPGT
jgi:5-formyltetrahydrofolate cyclo-ligase